MTDEIDWEDAFRTEHEDAKRLQAERDDAREEAECMRVALQIIVDCEINKLLASHQLKAAQVTAMSALECLYHRRKQGERERK